MCNFFGAYMFLKTTISQGHKYLQIIQSYRKDGKAKHRVVANLGRADAIASSGWENIIAAIQKYLDKTKSNIRDLSTLKETARVNYGYIAYKKLWEKYSITELLDNLIDKSKIDYDFSSLIFLIVIDRLLLPSSKRSYYLHRDRYFQYDASLELHQIYRSLDILSENKEKIEQYIFNKNRTLFNMKVDIVFYDVTTYHFESQREDELRDFGFSKANKINEVQVVMGLLIDSEGRPVGYELFPGNTFDSKTMLKVLKKLKNLFGLQQVIIVADKGLNAKINLKEIRDNGFDYIVSARIKNMQRSVEEEILSEKDYKEKRETQIEQGQEEEIYRYKVIDYQNKVTYEDEQTKEKNTVILKEKMVCIYSSKRAKKDLRDRNRAIEKAEKIVNQQNHTELNEKRGYKKYITTKSKSEDKKENPVNILQIDKERIERESRFDGYSAIEYSREDLSAEEVIEQYHNLYKIEESFRILKSTMKTRPIYLRTKEHIEGHFVICFFAFLLERELELRLRKRQIEFSSEKIKEALNTVEFSEVEIEGEKYYLKGKQAKLASDIFALLRIKQPRHLLSKEEAIEYISQ